MSLAVLPRRMLRAARLEADFYEEVEAEPNSIRQAFIVVLLACTAGFVGSWIRDVSLNPGAGPPPWLRLAVDVVEPLVYWLVGSMFAYMAGATFFKGPETETDYAEVLRTTGFAFTPGLLRIFAFVPPPSLGLALMIGSDLWMLCCGVVAVRQALDFTTLRAAGTFGVAYVMLWLLLR